MTNIAGAIYYTTNGSDPRVPFTGEIAPDARRYQSSIPLVASGTIAARSLNGTNWSAITEAAFLVDQPVSPLRITEIMYNPAGGEAYQFIELANLQEEIGRDPAERAQRGERKRPEPGPLDEFEPEDLIET